MSRKPVEQTEHKTTVAQALRIAIMAELEAINLYEELAEQIEDEGIRKVFLDIAREEKTHVGEFLQLLLQVCPRAG